MLQKLMASSPDKRRLLEERSQTWPGLEYHASACSGSGCFEKVNHAQATAFSMLFNRHLADDSLAIINYYLGLFFLL
jgi:hypothetical protein